MNSQVEQVDREAAARFYGRYLSRPGEVPVAAAMSAGEMDDSPLIQAFARHRLASLASQPPVLDEREVIDMPQGIADAVRSAIVRSFKHVETLEPPPSATSENRTMSHDAREVIERIMQAIRNEQARCDELDHFLDAKECIDVIRETFAAEDTPATTLSPGPVLLGEVREALEEAIEEIEDLRGYANSHGGMIDNERWEGGRDLLAKLPKLTGEEV